MDCLSVLKPILPDRNIWLLIYKLLFLLLLAALVISAQYE